MSAAGRQARMKGLAVLCAAAVAASVLGLLSQAPAGRHVEPSEIGRRVLPAYESKIPLLALIMVTTREESYHLVRNGDEWVLAEKGSYPVSADRIAALNRALSAITYAEAMTRDERKLDRIGLGDPLSGGAGALLEAGDGRGTNFAKLIIGAREGASYVRRPDEAQAWAVAGPSLPPLQRALAWLDFDALSLPADEIAEVAVTPVSGPAYRLMRGAGADIVLAPPHDGAEVLAPLGPLLVAEAMARLSPLDVAPASEVASGPRLAEHLTRTTDGLTVKAEAWRSGARGWITLRASAEPGATQAVRARASDINTRADGWAFALSGMEWDAFVQPLSAFAR
jgi:hypothetical protein